jgi:hypothetical protein
MKKSYWAFAAPLLIGAAPPFDADTRGDVRCFIAISSLAGNPDPKVAISALTGAQYFLGRIDGRTPSLDLGGAVMAEAKTMTPADYPPLLRSCGLQLKKRGEAVTAIGQRMQAEAAHSSSSSS